MEVFKLLDQIIKDQSNTNTLAETILASRGSPTTSIAVLDQGKISAHCISTEGHNDETLFQACSISKTVTSLATAILVHQKKLNFNDKIADLLPSSVMQILETPFTKHLLGEITVKMLMSHTSGLSQHGFPGYTGNVPSTLQVLGGKSGVNTNHVHLEGIPGYRFSYSGGGMTVLQLLLEHITNQTFANLVKELIFDPLDMQRSFYDISQETNHAVAYYTGFTPCEVPYHTNPEQAAAGLWTTPSDLLKLIRAVQRSLKASDDTELLSKDVAQQMLTEVSETMALGWFAPRDPGIAFGHGGSNDPGWRCFFAGYADLDFDGSIRGKENKSILDTDCGIAVMTNSAAGDEICAKVVNTIVYIKGWSAVPCWYGIPAAAIPFVPRSCESDSRWMEWTGTWSGGWKIEKGNEGEAMARFGNLPAVKLLAVPAPTMKHANTRELNMVLEGLEMMMSFQEEGERLIVIRDGGSGTQDILRLVE